MIDWNELPIGDENEDEEEQQQDGGGLFGDLNQFSVAWQHWGGMPEFNQDDLEPWRTCVVKFRTPEDRQAFAELIGQPIRGWRGGTMLWYPKMEIQTAWDWRYRDASGDQTGTVPSSTMSSNEDGTVPSSTMSSNEETT